MFNKKFVYLYFNNLYHHQKEVYMPKTNKRKHLKNSNTVSKILLLFFLLSIGTVKNLNAQTFGGGDGLSKATAYEIYTKAHLQELSDSIINTSIPPNPNNWTSGKHFRLMNNIDNVDFIIGGGNLLNTWRYLRGHFHGGGNKITLAISSSISTAHHYVALFTGLANGSIDSLEVDGFVTNTAANSYAHTSGIVGLMNSNSVVSNSINNAKITSYSYTATGIAANAENGTIINCVNNSKISGYHLAAGITLFITSDGMILNCINNGEIVINTVSHPYSSSGASGIVIGVSGIASVLNCINLGTITGTAKYYHPSAISGTAGIACFVNSGTMSKISNNINYGFVQGINNVGSIVGVLQGAATVENNFNSGVVIGDENVGCIIGLITGNGTVINNHYDKQMCGEED